MLVGSAVGVVVAELRQRARKVRVAEQQRKKRQNTGVCPNNQLAGRRRKCGVRYDGIRRVGEEPRGSKMPARVAQFALLG